MKANPSRQNPDLPFILGAQYYRAPTPEPSDWEHDFAQMAESGFNTVKLWAQWRWNNPAEGVYDFSDLEKLLELAERYGLKVIINTILDVAPAWVFERWPESRLVTLDGRVLGPAALQHRQIGGAPGCCFHHTASAECAYEFLARCAEALKSSPALLAWDAWNEPELTCALARAPKLENLVCYCPASLQAFKEWLRKRYGDSLEALNTAWGRNYADWQEVEVPRSFGTFRDMLDWRRFFLDTLTAELRRRVQVLKAHDPAHPVMAHTVPFPIFNLATCASDDFELAAECDFFGNSAGSSAMAADLLQSAAQDKLVLNAEVHALPGSTFYQFQPLQPKDVDSFLLAPLAQNIKGFLFWQYRPERLGLEAPNWGLTDLAGNPTPWLKRVGKVFGELQRRSDFLLRARPRPADVGLLLEPENELFHWAASFGTDFYTACVSGAYKALHRANYQVTFVHPSTLRQAFDLPVIYCPAPYWLTPETLELLKEYVARGGRLVAEPYFAGMDATRGLHETVVPGAGWHELFKTTQGLVSQPQTAAFDAYHTGAGEAAAAGTWLNVRFQTQQVASAAWHQVVELQPHGSFPLGTFSNGWCGLTYAQYEQGGLYLVGTYLGGAVWHNLQGADELICALCATEQSARRPHSEQGTVRVDVLSDGKFYMVVAASQVEGKTEDALRFHMVPGRLLVDVLSSQEFPLRAEGDWNRALIPFEGGQVRLLEVV